MTDYRPAACAAAIPSDALDSAMLCAPLVAHADAVAEWNATAIAVTANPPNSILQSRVLAIVQGAVFDALNAVERRHPPMGADVTAVPGASQEAAMASAAHHIFSRLAPSQQTTLLRHVAAGRMRMTIQRALFLATTALAVAASPARANTVTDWNQTAERALLQGGVGNAILQSRALSTTQVAVFDAVNSITGEYEAYAVTAAAAPGTSADAAAAAAAHEVLVQFIPAQIGFLDGAYATSLAGIPDGQGKTDGIALGESVAAQIIALRSSDGFTSGGTYVPKTGPGFWQPTPPAFGAAIFPLLPRMTPWTLASANQFRGKGPAPLTSKRYTKDFAEVQSVGSINSTTRTQNQTDAANFWFEGAPLTWNRIARPFAVSAGLSLTATARLFAQLGMAYMDGFIAGFDTKYTYEFWRPVTAIRATTSDTTWAPLRPTPGHPDYVSTHSVLGAAAAAILGRTFGRHVAFTTTGSSTAPTVVRSYNSFHEASVDNSNSRVWVGVHFRRAVDGGQKMGDKIGKQISRQFLRRADGGDDEDDDDGDNDD